MIRRTFQVTILLLSVGIVPSCNPARQPDTAKTPQDAPNEDASKRKEEQAVEKAFEAYRSALLKQDGKAAAETVSSGTIKMYQEYRDLAVSGDEPTVKKLSLVNRLQVLTIRHRIEPKLLKAMDGKAIFSYAVDQNWISNSSVVSAVLGDVTISNSRAVAKVSFRGKPSNEVFQFVKEQEHWKFDLAPTIAKADQALQQVARIKGMSENEFLFSMISTVSGRQVTDAIWQPLK